MAHPSGHDVSDIFLDLMKMANYLKVEGAHGLYVTEICFVLNTYVSWYSWLGPLPKRGDDCDSASVVLVEPPKRDFWSVVSGQRSCYFHLSDGLCSNSDAIPHGSSSTVLILRLRVHHMLIGACNPMVTYCARFPYSGHISGFGSSRLPLSTVRP